MVERTDVEVRGGSLAVYRFGSGDPQVLAVHGITGNSHSWGAVGEALGDQASLLAVDLRGRGRSNGLPAPYGIKAYVDDLLAVLASFGTERGVLAGHSLGAYIVARLAAEHPERVAAAVLVDGGLTLDAPTDVDPQAFIDDFLGPVIARLRLQFPSLEAYLEWWRQHPSFVGPEITDAVLQAYAEHDLAGEPPELRSSVLEEAVRADATELHEFGKPAQRMTVPATLLAAPRGLLNDQNPMQPWELVKRWAAAAPEQRQAKLIPDTNHYTLLMGTAGATAVAEAIAARL